jgi:hypothetical protein
MTPDRCAAVEVDGAVTVDMQQCHVEVRVRGCWTQVSDLRLTGQEVHGCW